MTYSLFPGCSLDSSAKNYRESLDWTLQALGVEVKELPDWNCCGATSTHALHTPYVDAIPARNLAIAEEQGNDLLVACSACYHRLQHTHQTLSENAEARTQMESVVGKPLKMERRVYNLLEILASEDILNRVRQEHNDVWKGTRVGCYYGCLAVRLPGIQGFEDPENPTTMDDVVESTGAEVIDWPYQTRCCGASLSVTGPQYAQQLSEQILQMAARCRLDLLVTGCPFCQYNLDLAQWQRDNQDSATMIPVIFITQFLGMALGATAKQMALESNLTGVDVLKRRVQA